MRQLLFVLAMAFATIVAQAAISVGAAGSGTITFGNLPPSTEWSTRSISGVDLSFISAADLNNAVQTNASAISINTPLVDGFGANPPSQNTIAAWTTGGTSNLWTRPTANAATLLMATLQNTSGADQTRLRIVYTLGQSGATPAEQAPAHQVYYSLSGELGSWINIPGLSGGGIGVRSNNVTLVGTWANGAPLYVLWVDDNATGGVDRGYSIDDISFTSNTRPTLASVPDTITDVLRPVIFTALAADSDAPQDRLAYSLDAGAPAAAQINPTNGHFFWRPARTDAATTNQITLRVTDDAVVPLSVTQTFTVIVRDYIEVTVGSVVVDVGQRTNVFLECVSTTPLTNVTFAMLFPTDRLTALDLENLVPSIASAAMDVSQPNRVSLTFAALPGEFLVGTQQLARLHFTAAAEQSSAFIPLQLAEIAGGRAQPGLSPSVIANHGRVVAVNGQPLLEAFAAGGARTLTLYGRPGTNYSLETSTGIGGSWQPWQSVMLSNLFQSIDASEHTNAPIIFYRAHDGTAAPATFVPQAPSEFKAAAKLKKRKVAAALKRLQRLRGRMPWPPSELLP